jgi:hypothetical protein
MRYKKTTLLNLKYKLLLSFNNDKMFRFQNVMHMLLLLLPVSSANLFLAPDGSSYPATGTAPVAKQEWIARYLSNINSVQPAFIVSSCSETYSWNLSFDDGPG